MEQARGMSQGRCDLTWISHWLHSFTTAYKMSSWGHISLLKTVPHSFAKWSTICACLPANAGTAQRKVKMRQELYRNGPSLMPRSLGMTIQASTATTTFPTIQKVAKRLNIIPLLLGGWNSPKYVQTTGILPPTLQKPRLSRLLTLSCVVRDKANLAKIAFRWTVQ